MASVNEAISKLGGLVIILPPGETSKVQILDLGINKPLKNHLNNIKLSWQRLNEDKKASRTEMVDWSVEGWRLITKETILNTVRSIGMPSII
jgi:hypothetical protein